MRKFDSRTEKQVLALAISLEEEDERIYADYAAGLTSIAIVIVELATGVFIANS